LTPVLFFKVGIKGSHLASFKKPFKFQHYIKT